MLKHDNYTAHEMTLEFLKVVGISPEGVDFDSHETVKATDNFAMDNGYYFFAHEWLYKKLDDVTAPAKVEFFTLGFKI